MSEQQMWTTFRKRIVHLDPQRVETRIDDGIPDVNYTGGWIELKYLPKWPRDPSAIVKIDHYTPQQRAWGLRRWRAGGMSWLLLHVREDNSWMLFDGYTAQDLVGKARRELLDWNAAVSVKSPSDPALLHMLVADPEDMPIGLRCRLARLKCMKHISDVACDLNWGAQALRDVEAGTDGGRYLPHIDAESLHDYWFA